MPNFTRKMLIIRPLKKPSLPQPHDRNTLPPPLPLPPPPPPLHHHHLSPLIVIMLCTLATTVSLLFYVAIIKACRTFQKRSRIRTHRNINTNETTHQDFVDQEHGSIVFHPIWLINTIGVDQSVIDSIEVLNYKKGNGLFIDSDCAVCLGEFEDEESLRILPKCNHAFHVNCIDTWLRSHKNCPVCRAPVMKNTKMESNLIESNTQEEIPIRDLGNETPEIDRNGCLFGIRVQSDLIDYRRCCHEQESESKSETEPETMRRSVSMIQLAAGNGNGDQESNKENVLQKSTKNRSFFRLEEM